MMFAVQGKSLRITGTRGRLTLLRQITCLALLVAMLSAASGHSHANVQRWRMDPKPLRRFGATGRAGAHDFREAIGGLRLTNGDVVVGDGSASRIVLHRAKTGAQVFAGRAGSGPGEFDVLMSLHRAGDTVVAEDSRGVSQVFAPDLTYVRTERRSGVPSAATAAFTHGYLDDGSAVVSYRVDAGVARTKGQWIDVERQVAIVRGAKITTLADVVWGRARIGERREEQGEVFAAQGQVVVLPASVCVGVPRSPEMTCFGGNGRQRGKLRWKAERPAPVTEVDRRIWLDGIFAANPGDRGKSYRDYVSRTVRFAPRMPYFGRSLGSRDSLVWVGPVVPADLSLGRASPLPSAPTQWRIFSPSGTEVASIVIPAGFRLLEAGRDYVLVIVQNDDGDDVVQLHRLIRS